MKDETDRSREAPSALDSRDPIHPSAFILHPSNRAYLLTPPGPGAIAVIRLIGPRTRAFLDIHLSKPPIEGRCVHADLRAGDQVLDDPVVVLLDAGRTADISLHGGPWVIRSVLALAESEG